MRKKILLILAVLAGMTVFVPDVYARNLFKEFIQGVDLGKGNKMKDVPNKMKDSEPALSQPSTSMVIQTAASAFDFNQLLNRAADYNYYVDSVNGKDTDNGLSEATPMATLDKLGTVSLKPNTVVNLKRGSVFRGKIKAQNDVTYQAYGDGAKPVMLGSVPGNVAAQWTKDKAANVWIFKSSHPGFAVDIGNIIFNDGAEVGVRVFEQKKLTADKMFWFDKKNRLVKLYSTQDPRQRWGNIEFATPIGGIEMNGNNGVVVKDLVIKYVSGHAVSVENCQNIVIDGLDMVYIGGSNLFGIINIPGVKRYGNAVEIYKSGKNILVQNNIIDQVYDAALTNQSYEAEAHHDNIVYKNNKVSNSEYCFELWIYAPNSTMKNVLAENNVCQYSGWGWGHNQRPDGVNGRNLMVFKNAAQTQNVVFHKNKFFPATESQMKFADPNDQQFFTFTDNEMSE
jgi:hypothetical protein